TVVGVQAAQPVEEFAVVSVLLIPLTGNLPAERPNPYFLPANVFGIACEEGPCRRAFERLLLRSLSVAQDKGLKSRVEPVAAVRSVDADQGVHRQLLPPSFGGAQRPPRGNCPGAQADDANAAVRALSRRLDRAGGGGRERIGRFAAVGEVHHEDVDAAAEDP